MSVVSRLRGLMAGPAAGETQRETALAPYQRPDYVPPVRVRAEDLMPATARWPLVMVLESGGWDVDGAGQAKLNLASPRDGGPSRMLQVTLPFAEGDLFDKRGSYIVAVLPATSREQVAAIMAAAGELT